MPIPLVTAAAGGFLSLFNYNKANYLYDKGQHMTRTFTGISYKLQQFGLYRQDVRDLVSLTTNTTSNYHLVATLELGMCVTLLGPARLPEDVPEWVLWFTTVAICNAFAVLACSMWLATRAAIIAESLNVRLQTQYIRLPFPDDETLDEALTKAEHFEAAELQNMCRLPFLKSVFDTLLGSGEDEKPKRTKSTRSCRSANTNAIMKTLSARSAVGGPRPLLSESHLTLYRQLQKQWQGFDAYARVTISIGTYWLCLALAYYQIGWTLCHQRQALPAGGVALIFASTVALLMYMDLHITRAELVITAVLVFAGPVCVLVGSAQEPYLGHVTTYTPWSAVSAGVAHALFTLWIWYSGQSDKELHLPTRFLGVQYLDVFGPMINEIRASMGKTARHDAADALQRTKEDLKNAARRAGRWCCMSGAKEVAGEHDSKLFHKQDARERLASAMDQRTGSLRRQQQLLAAATQIAEAAGIADHDAQLVQARRTQEKLATLQDLTRLRRVVRRWLSAGAMQNLQPEQAREIQQMDEDIALRISQLDMKTSSTETVCSSRSTSRVTSDSDTFKPISHVHSVKYDIGGYGDPNDEYEYWIDDDDDDDFPENYRENPSLGNKKKLESLAKRCEKVLSRADRVIFDASHNLKTPGPVLLGKGERGAGVGKPDRTKEVRFQTSDQSKPSKSSNPSKRSVGSTSTHASTASSMSHLAALVRHATEPLHKVNASTHFENTLAMTMPVRLYNTLMMVLLLVWLGGAAVHAARIANVKVAWYIRPIQRGRLLSEVKTGSFLSRRLSNIGALEGKAALEVTWPEPFFRPRSLVCIGSEGVEQPTGFIGSNGFMLFPLMAGRATAEQIHCPVSRHDSIVTGRCNSQEGCSAIVAADGALWRCSSGSLDHESSQARPLASLTKNSVHGQVAMLAWAAVDSNLERLFAAPRQGALMEFRRTGDALWPVAELQLPPRMPADMEWKTLSVQGDTLLAVTTPSVAVYAWNITTGAQVGSWNLAPSAHISQRSEKTTWCTEVSTGLGRRLGLHGLAASNEGAELRNVELPSRI